VVLKYRYLHGFGIGGANCDAFEHPLRVDMPPPISGFLLQYLPATQGQRSKDPSYLRGGTRSTVAFPQSWNKPDEKCLEAKSRCSFNT
jgi:hypothetical protein